MTEPIDPSVHTMHCMEIRGGNKAVEHSIVMPGLDLWVYSQPYHAQAQGGDVHYVSLCGGGIISRLIVADVSGHGSEVAEFSDALRTLMRRNINSKSQKRLVQALNRQFTELVQLKRFATAIVATYLATTDRLAVCNAGHPRPLWFRAETQTWSLISPEAVGQVIKAANLPFGIDSDSSYEQLTIKLEPGDIVVIYTDALMEAMDPSRSMLGEEGLLEIARSVDRSTPSKLGGLLLEGVDNHRAGEPPDDDMTVVVLHHNGGPARKMGLGEKLDVYAKVFGFKGV